MSKLPFFGSSDHAAKLAEFEECHVPKLKSTE
jgi:hypothetical protein